MIVYNRGGQSYRRAPKKPGQGSLRTHWLWWSAAAVVAVFVLANLCTWAYYRNRTYPNATIAGHPAGNLAYSAVAGKAAGQGIIPARLTLTDGTHQLAFAAADLGVKADVSRTVASVGRSRSWLPAANFLT